MLKKSKLLLQLKRGSAIIMALIVMTVLLLLGLAVVTVSMGILRNNAADASNNDAYYAAESAVTSAIEQLKYEVSAYYMDMVDTYGNELMALYNNFFPAINGNAQLHFTEPVFSGITTATTFIMGTFDENDKTCEFLITSTATAPDGAQYRVDGRLLVKKLDVSDSRFDWIPQNAAILAGGTFDLESKNSALVVNGDVIVAQILYDAKNTNPYSITGGQLIIDPNAGLSIRDRLTYPSFATPVLADPYYVVSSTSYNWSNLPSTFDSDGHMNMETTDGVSLHFNNCRDSNNQGLPAGVIYCKGDISISNCDVHCDIYCDGNVSISNASSIYGTIYCRGNASINNANIYCSLYSDGFVSFTNNGSLSSAVYAEDGIDFNNCTSGGNLYSPAQITLTNATVTDGLIYSSTKLLLGGTSETHITAALFSGGDIEFTGDTYVNGCMVAKNDIYFKVDANKDLHVIYAYSPETIDDIYNDPDNSFFFTVPGTIRLDENVFLGHNITAVGRQ
jgi:predicted acyltransferase (DUF342 family)